MKEKVEGYEKGKVLKVAKKEEARDRKMMEGEGEVRYTEEGKRKRMGKYWGKECMKETGRAYTPSFSLPISLQYYSSP